MPVWEYFERSRILDKEGVERGGGGGSNKQKIRPMADESRVVRCVLQQEVAETRNAALPQ